MSDHIGNMGVPALALVLSVALLAIAEADAAVGGGGGGGGGGSLGSVFSTPQAGKKDLDSG